MHSQLTLVTFQPFMRCDTMIEIRRLNPSDVPMMKAMLRLFGEVFGEMDTYTAHTPSDDYLRRLLEGESFIGLAATVDGDIVGGIGAYELKKFEQDRSEVYIYDLAVAAGHRRKGIATRMIEEMKLIAIEKGAHVMFVQADTGVEDEPAIALYSSMGKCERVLHFDIPLGECPD